jgi:hypothetical protein
VGRLNPTQTINYKTGGAIAAYRIVRHGSADDTVVQASAATDAVFGVSTSVPSAANDRCCVIEQGIAEVEYGGTVTRGQQLVADAQGRAVAAAPSAGANVRTIGIAQESGVVGDIGSVKLAPGSLQG